MTRTVSVPRIDLAPGYSISRLLKGGWQLAGGHGDVDREAAIDDMFRFVEAGITTLDCADIYTGVEELIGEFLRRYRERHATSSADGIQVHTKFVPDLAALATFSRADAIRGVDRSLLRLGVDRLDLVQFHWWDYDVPRYVEVAGWLDELRAAGKIRHLGVTNFDVPRLREILDAGIPIASIQLQYSVIDRRPLHAMAELCRSRDIRMLCYGALAGGFLSARYVGAPAPDEPLENRSLVKYRLIIEEFGGWLLFQELIRVLASVAHKHGVGVGTVALRWVLDQSGVAGAIVGARHRGHLLDTCAVSGLALDDDDRSAIEEVQARGSGPRGDTYGLERAKGGRHATIMKYNLNTSRR
jgi:aryl-alcohol dehydrogenase-like predicted oxidoreductase